MNEAEEKEKGNCYDKAMVKLQDYLYSKGLSIDALPSGRRERYVKVALALEKRIEAIEKAEIITKTNRINIHSIAEETGISNRTFYNDDILKGFVDRSTHCKKNKMYDDIHEELRAAKETIEKLVRNVIETETLKENIRALEEENGDLHSQLDALEVLLERVKKDKKPSDSDNSCVLIDMQTGKRRIIKS